MKDNIKAWAAGSIGAALGGAGTFFVGQLSDHEALVLLETVFPTTRFLCSAIMTSSATILALMLTMLGLTESEDFELRPLFYKRIRRIAQAAVTGFVGGLLLLLLLNVPLEETKAVPTEWYTWVYYLVVGGTSLLAGLLIAVVIMLYRALSGMTRLLGHGDSQWRWDNGEGESDG